MIDERAQALNTAEWHKTGYGDLSRAMQYFLKSEAEARNSLEKIRDWSSKSLDLATCSNGPWDLNVYQESIKALAAIPPHGENA